jgi:hypothetical protein
MGIVSMDYRRYKARLAFLNKLEREPNTLAAKAWRAKPTHKLQRVRAFRSAMMASSIEAVITKTRCDAGSAADGAPTKDVWMAAACKHLSAREHTAWQADMEAHTSLRRYRRVKSKIYPQEYLSALPAHTAEMLFKLRSNAAPTAAFLRWRGEDNLCKVCNSGAVETVEHLLLDCGAYRALRQQLFTSCERIGQLAREEQLDRLLDPIFDEEHPAYVEGEDTHTVHFLTECVKRRHELAHPQGGDGEALDDDTESEHSSGEQCEVDASSGGDASGGLLASGGGEGRICSDDVHVSSVSEPVYDPSFISFPSSLPVGAAELDVASFVRGVREQMSSGANVPSDAAI